MPNVKGISKLGHLLLAAVLVLMLSPFSMVCQARVAYAAEYTTSNPAITGFDVTSDGANVTLTFTGNAWTFQQDVLAFSFESGQSVTYKVCVNNDQAVLRTPGWADVPEVQTSVTRYHDQAHNWGEGFQATYIIPLSILPSDGAFSMTFCGTSVTSEQMGATSSGSGSGSGSGGGSGSGSTGTEPGGQTGGQSGGTETGGNGTNVGTLEPTVPGFITVDGENRDWIEIPALPSNNEKIPEWKLARDADGNVYLMVDGKADSQWDYAINGSYIEFSQNGSTVSYEVGNLAQEIGAMMVTKNNANWNTADTFVIEAMIPASYFTDPNATIKFVGKEVAVDDVPVIDGTDVTPDIPTVYDGIVIDGQYYDWAPVTKYPSNDDAGLLQQVAMVWDGDMVYLYIEETPNTLGAYNAGTHGNGKFEIITDTGRRQVFQVYEDGSISGLEGVTSAHTGNKWEIAIPASNLPEYMETIGFGLYLGDPMISDVSNVNGSGGNGGSGDDFAGIVYDGHYSDWDYYPHHIIQYNTPGTQEDVPDAEGALYTDAEEARLYGHVKVTLQQHLDNQNGNEFTTGVTIRFNDSTSLDFYPLSTTVDDQGNINWYPQTGGLANGTYEFRLMSRDAWHSSSNINDTNEYDIEYGRMYVTISDTADECEFYLDLNKIANKLGLDANDFKTISSQFINIGGQWITTAGTSTMPFVGIGLGIATVVGVLGTRRLRGRSSDVQTTQDQTTV